MDTSIKGPFSPRDCFALEQYVIDRVEEDIPRIYGDLRALFTLSDKVLVPIAGYTKQNMPLHDRSNSSRIPCAVSVHGR